MAKVGEAIGGAALLAAGIALDVMTAGTATPFEAALASFLIGTGASLALTGVGGLIAGNPQAGLAVANRNPIQQWQYLYGTCKVGPTIIFETTNSSQDTSNDKQLHRVMILSCHSCQGNVQLRLDGQPVPMTYLGTVNDALQYVSYTPTQTNVLIGTISRSNGLATIVLEQALPGQNGLRLAITYVGVNSPNNEYNAFNGIWIVAQPNANDATTFTFVNGGPDLAPTTGLGGVASTTYPDYADKVYLEVQLGNQTQTFPGLLASGTGWGPKCVCAGFTVAYLRLGYADEYFGGGIPQTSFVIDGKKDILDPRTNTRGFTDNAALCVADFMSLDTSVGGFGLAIGTNIQTAQLSAAANICDEPINLAAGGTEPRYTCNAIVPLNMTRGAILAHLLATCAGRLSYQGGIYNILPGAWVGSTFALTVADLVGPIQLKPRLSIRDTCNGVKGTYIAAANDYQMADFPIYIQDAYHGYATDQYLLEDGGERIFRDVALSGCNSPSMAQRLAKIELMRTRYQGRYTVRCTMRAYQVVALDVITITLAKYGWSNKLMEVLASRFVQHVSGQDGAAALLVELDLADTDPSIYDWYITEELSPQGYASPAQRETYYCPEPEQLTLYSGPGATINGTVYPSTIHTGADGISRNSLYAVWLAPNDGYVLQGGGYIEIQYQRVGDAAWQTYARVDAASVTYCFIQPVSDGLQYLVRIRAVNCAGTPSAWVDAGPETISSTLSMIAYSGVQAAANGTLIGIANADGTGSILIGAFTAMIGAQTASCSPSPSEIDGLNQGQLYEVYYIDPYFAGGIIAPVATQNTADYLSKAGYFLIGTVYVPSGSPVYRPTTYSDTGALPTQTPIAAYGGDLSTSAVVIGYSQLSSGGMKTYVYGSCTWSGFAAFTAPAAMKLTVRAAFTGTLRSGEGAVTATIAGVTTTMASEFTATDLGATYYTLVVPAGTDLSSVSVNAAISGGNVSTAPLGRYPATVSIFEIWIQ